MGISNFLIKTQEKGKRVYKFILLFMMAILPSIAFAEDIFYPVPHVFYNYSIRSTTEHPSFLTKRGDFRELKRRTGNGKGVKVGIVDTGLDRTHAAVGGDLELYNGSNLSTYVVREAKDFTSRNPSDWADRSNHGSHVAGVIGAAGNGRGIEGIASDCELYIAKGLGDSGFGSDTQISNSIDWLISKKVQIINLSLGGGFSSRIEAAVNRANQAGIIVFAAMGNSGPRENTGGHPGTSPNSLGITALDYNLKIARFSSRSKMAIMAGYGVNVYSCATGGRYVALSGTSMATPDQVGICALILSYAKSRGVEIRNARDYFALVKPAFKDLGRSDHRTTGWDAEYGYGFLDVWKALSRVDEAVTGSPNPTPTPDPINEFKDYERVNMGDYLLLKKKFSSRSNNKLEEFRPPTINLIEIEEESSK